VVAIHGDYDPHPTEGVREPLSKVLKDFRFIMLEHCGHLPWIEREAREGFFELLRGELD
jgi:pimeloyl-ACP methyl ester carboxylesterase